jgi:tripartite-type tricarboxylate transporter receptor subunit TctC
MKIPRRRFLQLAVGATALPAVSGIASAQSYPTRPVRIVVGYAAGGGTDLVARLMGQWLSERLGQPFIIENRPGAGTNVGTQAVVRAPLPGLQEKGKFVAPIDSAAFAVSDVNILRACTYHFDGFLNCLDGRIAAKHYLAV